MGRKSYLGGSTRVGVAGFAPGGAWTSRNRIIEKSGGYRSGLALGWGGHFDHVRDELLRQDFTNSKALARFFAKPHVKPYVERLCRDPKILARLIKARKRKKIGPKKSAPSAVSIDNQYLLAQQQLRTRRPLLTIRKKKLE